jgi:metacaspase-1
MFGKLMKEAEGLGKSLAEEKLKMDLDGDGKVGGASAEQARADTDALDDGANIPLSACDGNKKSLFIGINYFGSKSELRGCINDVVNIKKFVVEHFKFPEDADHMKTLTDDDEANKPTRANILQAFDWLVSGAKAGDSLFFHYSGHGGGNADKTADTEEQDGQDETLVPVDYESAGQIVDDDLHAKLIATLPAGVRLTAIMDCCHSGSVFDLPYTVR